MIQSTIQGTMLNHPIKDHLTDSEIHRLFDEDGDIITRFNSFCSRLETVAEARHGGDDDKRNKFKGDLFELFVEFLLKTKGHDNRVGIDAYQTSQEAGITDYGVDGIGKSTINSRICTVQAKYRQHGDVLTWNEGNFGNFGFESLKLIINVGGAQQYPTDNTQMLYVTSAGDVHYSVDDISSGLIRVINRQGLRDLCDGVCEFWIQLKNSILASRIQRQEVSPPKRLRDHQRCAVGAIINDMLRDDGQGRVVLPTGTGKTLIQAQTIIEAHQDPNLRHKCFLILSPRILLSFQHLAKVSNHLIRSGVDAQLLNVNSGNFDEEKINEERCRAGLGADRIPSTTRPDEIARALRAARAEDKPLIISSTYHSAHRIREAGIEVDLQLNDEAHNMVSDEFAACHGIGNNSFHFTATERHTDADDGLGMQNEERWGNLTFERLPKDMINAGEMLPPVLHVVETRNQPVADNDYGSIFAAIGESFDVHRNRLKSGSVDPESIGPKMLVTVGGQEALRGLVGGPGQTGCSSFELFRKDNPRIRIFAISSELGAYVDGRWLASGNRSKDELLQEIRGLSDADEAIILYVDMLTEGIDVPGITAFMPLRGMGHSRFKQGIGRAVRLNETDRDRFYAGEISPDEPSEYVKPDAEIIVPTILINSRDTAASFTELWQSMYDAFGHQERVVLSRLRGMDDESTLEDLNEVEHNQRGVSSGVDEFLHEVVGRPDQLEVNKIALISAIGQGSDEALIRRLREQMNLQVPLDTYRSIADWQGANFEDYSQDLIRAMRTSGNSVFSEQVKKKFGTIYTPEFVVEKTVDLAWKYLPEGINRLDLTYCDPAAGDGNFLEHLHEKLMRETFIMDPVKRSHFILTKCLYGFEILEPMVQACKVRLILAHQRVIDEHGGDREGLLTLWDELKIFHGNTICLPEDTESEWYGERNGDEGGILPEELRNQRFDVIVGNPPYTHLRNMQNRRYAAYPKQRDMAQVFVRWSLDHLTHRGVCSLNTTNTWLRFKLADGARETRTIVAPYMREVVQDQQISDYSKSDGGDVSTMILCFGDQSADSFVIGDRTIPSNSILAHDAIRLESESRWRVCYHTSRLHEHRFPAVKFNTAIAKQWSEGFVFVDEGDGDWYIMVRECITDKTFINFKLVRTLDPKLFLDKTCCGRSKYASMDYLRGVWAIGFLNCQIGRDATLAESEGKLPGNHRLSTRAWQRIPIPDFDFYKQDRPERFQAYMDWIESNMRDKDAFLAGIDEQFERLIADD